MPDDRGGRPKRIAEAVTSFLSESGLAARIEQASVVTEWARVVGPQIAGVTEAYAVTADGTLFVGVSTNAWMNELSMMEPQLVRALNEEAARAVGADVLAVRRIRWRLRRPSDAGRGI